MSEAAVDRLTDKAFSDLILGRSRELGLDALVVRSRIEAIDPALSDECDRLRQCLFSPEQDRDELSVVHEGIRYRASRMHTIKGEYFVLRKGLAAVPALERQLPKGLARYLLSRELRQGLVVISGSMGSGKTTTASSFLCARLSQDGVHAVTLEDPVELDLQRHHGDGICYQIEVADGDYGAGMKRMMRYNPRIIYLGELRDAPAAREAMRAAVNGHLIVTTLHASGVMETMQRLVAMAGEGDEGRMLLAGGFSGVIHQRLVEKDGGYGLSLQFLFAREESGDVVRAKIRSGELHQLPNEVQVQRNRLMRTGELF